MPKQSISNEELVEKATITTDALAAGGKLNPAQSDRFIDYVIDQTVLQGNTRVVRFRQESLEIDKMLWPMNHPYNWPVIGYMEDLTAASHQDVVEFFKKYYVPNNASLVVAGDFTGDGPVDAIFRAINAATKREARLREFRIDAVTGGHAAAGPPARTAM